MKPLSDEILIDYIFELLDEETVKTVEINLAQCPDNRKKLQILKSRFNQLELVEEKKNQPLTFIKSLTLAAAAIIIFSFYMGLPAPLSTVHQSATSSQSTPADKVNRAASDSFFQLEVFIEEQKEDYSLMAKLEAPLKNKFNLEVPKVKIHDEEDKYEIVDLNRYVSLTLPSGFNNPEISDIYSNLNLTNHIH